MGRARLLKGTSRCVLVIPPVFALKLPLNEIGAKCNLFEANIYATSCPRRQSILCPVIWCSKTGSAMLMKYARPLTDLEYNTYKCKLQFPDWEYKGPHDQADPTESKRENWGIINGEVVAVDYSINVCTKKF